MNNDWEPLLYRLLKMCLNLVKFFVVLMVLMVLLALVSALSGQ
uniref:Transmembrane protein n=1 Tax=Dulem virus 119 TaxID=3145596 RepID=A0AAU8B055_9VIRU